MYCLFMLRSAKFLLKNRNPQNCKHLLCSMYSAVSISNQAPLELQEICKVVSSSIGGLDDLESYLNEFHVHLTSTLVSQVLDSSKNEAPTRKLLRFFLWSHKRLGFDTKDEDFNHAIRVLAEKKDHTAMQILISDLRKESRAMEAHTFSIVAETLVKLGREDEALGIFKNLNKFKCPHDSETVLAIISALCAKGHAKKAYGVLYHHKDKISNVKPCVYRSLLYGWSMQENVKEARKVLQDMKAEGVLPDLFCYNTFLRCLCEKNLKRNPSGLVPESLNVMMEMRSYNIEPNSTSHNILLSCLQRARRVQESCRILERMNNTSSCPPDWTSYYLVVKVSYLTGRFGRGNKLVNEMIDKEIKPNRKFYYELIGVLCGVERVNFALNLFEHMKRSSMGGYGPVYDVLIPKLCSGGDFEKGKELWDEAMAMGVSLCCSVDVLDPSITEVFKPTRKVVEEVDLSNLVTNKIPKAQSQTRVRRKTKGKLKKKMRWKKGKRKSTKP